MGLLLRSLLRLFEFIFPDDKLMGGGECSIGLLQRSIDMALTDKFLASFCFCALRRELLMMMRCIYRLH